MSEKYCYKSCRTELNSRLHVSLVVCVLKGGVLIPGLSGLTRGKLLHQPTLSLATGHGHLLVSGALWPEGDVLVSSPACWPQECSAWGENMKRSVSHEARWSQWSFPTNDLAMTSALTFPMTVLWECPHSTLASKQFQWIWTPIRYPLNPQALHFLPLVFSLWRVLLANRSKGTCVSWAPILIYVVFFGGKYEPTLKNWKIMWHI